MSVIREGEDLILQLRYKMQSVGVFDLFTRAAWSIEEYGTEKEKLKPSFLYSN